VVLRYFRASASAGRSIAVGRSELEALVRILEAQLAQGPGNAVSGTWTISFDRERGAFVFDKCEFGAYCEERPTVLSLAGEVLDPGGPVLAD
jgi:hypothetical protein